MVVILVTMTNIFTTGMLDSMIFLGYLFLFFRKLKAIVKHKELFGLIFPTLDNFLYSLPSGKVLDTVV